MKINFPDFLLFKKKDLLIVLMKTFLIICFLTTFGFTSKSVFSQDTEIVIKSDKIVPVEGVFDLLKEQTTHTFIYSIDLFDGMPKISLREGKTTVGQLLKSTVSKLGYAVEYEEDGTILVFRSGSGIIPDNDIVEQEQSTVSGTVTDPTGMPIPGVNVIEQGTSNGVVTNFDGEFAIEVAPDAVLVFSYLGYETVEMPVDGQNQISITLETSASALEEVVVVGYGTQKKANLTGAVSEVDGEDLAQRTVSTTSQALQGMASGVTVRDLGGAPGKGNVDINIRGITTLGDSQPLILVDGVEQRITDLNPNNIESMTVLKDAASTAIYGSRAASGVVLITTKDAQPGELKVGYDGYYAIQTSVNSPEPMGLEDYLRHQNTAFINSGQDPKFTEEEIQNYLTTSDRLTYPLPHTWFDILYTPAPQQRHNFSVSGGSEEIQSLLILNHYKQDGVIPNYGSLNNGVRLKTDFALSERINISTNLNYRRREFTTPVDEWLVSQWTYHGSLWTVPKYPDGSYGLSPQGHNPLLYAEALGKTTNVNDYVVANFKGDVDLYEGLTFTTQFAAEVSGTEQKSFRNKLEVRDYEDPTKILKTFAPNELVEDRTSFLQTTLNSLLKYNQEFGKHDFGILAGYSEIARQDNGLSASRTNFFNNSVQVISQGSEASRDNNGFESEWALRSYFGRFNYAFAEKYLLELNGRYDGSSRFYGDNQYGFFPSLSVGWRISEEDFWSPVNDIVNDFKIRGSWGQTGNQTVGLYSYYGALMTQPYIFSEEVAPGVLQRVLANKNLSWETTTQTNIGFDAYFINNKLGLTFDYYHKRTEGILLELPIPAVVGLNPPPQNAGIVENKGWEMALNYRSSEGAINYFISANISDNVNKVIDLAGTGPYIEGWTLDPIFIIKEGLPINAHWGYKTDGLFQSQEEVEESALLDPNSHPGDVKYVDLNGDGIVNSQDMTMIGNPFPRYIFGLTSDLSYKGVGLSIQVQGVGKQDTRLSGSLAEGGNQEGFTPAIYTDYWTEDNPDARFPRPEKYNLRNAQNNDRLIINGAYIRLKNVQLSYSLPEQVLRDMLSSARVYISATNLLTISKLNEWGLDPEFPSGRANYYPQTRLITLGTNILF